MNDPCDETEYERIAKAKAYEVERAIETAVSLHDLTPQPAAVLLGVRAGMVLLEGHAALRSQLTRIGSNVLRDGALGTDPRAVIMFATSRGYINVYVSSAVDQDVVIPLYDGGHAFKLALRGDVP